ESCSYYGRLAPSYPFRTACYSARILLANTPDIFHRNVCERPNSQSISASRLWPAAAFLEHCGRAFHCRIGLCPDLQHTCAGPRAHLGTELVIPTSRQEREPAGHRGCCN